MADDPDLHEEGRGPEDRILLAEEVLSVGKRRVDRGGVRVSTRTETRTEAVRVALEDVAVAVERVPQGRFVEAAEGPRTESSPEGEVTILPVYEERAVVTTRLWLVEEVRLRRRSSRREEEVPVELRRQVASVEPIAPGAAPADLADDLTDGPTRAVLTET